VTKVVAIGDAHLGRNYLPVTTEGGVNQREVDFEIAFEAAVDLALAEQPDLIVWLGDIFDHPRPTYRSFRVAQRALVKIRDHGLPAVIISGNHDTPRLPGTGSPYSALSDTFDGLRFATRLQYEHVDVAGLRVHAVPQMMTVEHTLDALKQADANRSADRTNLLLTHPRITQVEPSHGDINEIEVDAGFLRSDLVLLGHYHFHTKVREGIWYAGSTDSFTFADDPDKPKGIVVLDTDSGELRHVPIDGRRPLITLETVLGLGRTPAELEADILARVATIPQGAVARLYIEGADAEAYRLLDLEKIREAASAALHLKLEPSFMTASGPSQLPDVEDLGAQWHSYLDEPSVDLTGYDRDRIKSLGDEYLAKAIEDQ
jgi:DNA repair exonuclease SbcCD nuclease subunit